mmetsp:Transcript_28346/g.65282  ORF Transcript_28346/g.65282 Transcript_28346/m.65282 type:complete len:267 (+) Transcript_28346:189-989(+)|eukprot:CAMPEP_0114541922 /NCGR_PEP_ID=MMETSP0114-20121206/1563_1 /TAXON_ID=31324 /ORGANISM="Goniomonas sp, Strain m" /LENGTH=266 /DNA_ID=CAMNT_0001726191 /DNA_START=107 /DNA_END=907 /DNA_ORIENTATION=+
MEICRDFLRGRCSRFRCRFLHTSDEARRRPICIDWLNGRCARENCRYLHCENPAAWDASYGNQANSAVAGAQCYPQYQGYSAVGWYPVAPRPYGYYPYGSYYADPSLADYAAHQYWGQAAASDYYQNYQPQRGYGYPSMNSPGPDSLTDTSGRVTPSGPLQSSAVKQEFDFNQPDPDVEDLQRRIHALQCEFEPGTIVKASGSEHLEPFEERDVDQEAPEPNGAEPSLPQQHTPRSVDSDDACPSLPTAPPVPAFAGETSEEPLGA